jgi:hypothetical protein
MSVDGEFGEVIEKIYLCFYREFKASKPAFGGVPVWWNQKPDPEDPRGYEAEFWNLIQGHNDDEPFHPGRASKLCWCAPVIQNSNDPVVTVFEYEEKGQIRTYLWLRDFDYVVVLRRREFRIGPVMWLITAHTVDGDSTRNKLQKKYENRAL